MLCMGQRQPLAQRKQELNECLVEKFSTLKQNCSGMWRSESLKSTAIQGRGPLVDNEELVSASGHVMYIELGYLVTEVFWTS